MNKQYVEDLFVHEDNVLQSIPTGLEAREMPSISVPKMVGKTLYLLAKMSSATSILEIGALGGYSTIWLAKALNDTGRVVSLELDPTFASFADENVAKAGLSDKVTYKVGDAAETLDQLIAAKETFDFFFIDADKPNYSLYLEKILQLARPGAIITADNLFQEGRVFDPDDHDPSPVAIRQFNETIAAHPQLESMILTIGDGLGVCRVK